MSSSGFSDKLTQYEDAEQEQEVLERLEDFLEQCNKVEDYVVRQILILKIN